MSIKCRFCRKAVIYPEQRLCVDHLSKFIEKRVDKVLGKVLGLEEKKILVTVSGGKDSTGLAHIMALRDLNMELLYLNLGIPTYSDASQKVVEDFAKARKLKLNIITLNDYGFTVKDFHEKQEEFRSNTCSLCGSAKRYLFNKFAFENGFDFIVTAHNLDDFASFAVMGISSGDLRYISKTASVSWPKKEQKTVGRIRPYFHVPEKASLIYSLSNNIPFFEGDCEYVGGNKQGDIKTRVAELERVAPGFRQHLVKFTRKSGTPETTAPKSCDSCGYPSAIDSCRFCRIKERLR
ncbi:MAG: adenine nucleotide alpha hydrolase family protein [Candidatus Altiarchaeota archaeon]|nr:adenine nucleotide alpha hydrolase family protein [Candidatus Altiarchaeota archaeon]